MTYHNKRPRSSDKDSDHCITLPSELGLNHAISHPSEMTLNMSCQGAPSHPSEMTYSNMSNDNNGANQTSEVAHNERGELKYFVNLAGTDALEEVLIDENIATGIDKVLTDGLSKEMHKQVASKYTPPSNCKRLNVVDCNPEVFKNASSRARYRDTSLQGVQKSLLKGLTAVALVFDELAKTLREDEVVEQLSDGVALLANVSHRLDVFRRQAFQGEFKEEYNSLCQASYPVTGSLFGPSIQEKIKEVQGSLKVARSTRQFQPFKQGTHSKRFPFLGQRQRWKQRGGGNMPQNNTQRKPWHQQKKGFQKRK
ncbi:hypothetical protein PoB_004665400 [Plakobranchus ocellatus]|uniref:Uncharacterized protein n=1 Tax=Plakobranchus ocellatus TaxID=259542 RepID=A0AAV4BJ57_9GAST|nr:hypothetical protein PoB_004665400 [Plakobranchus ocellatus]